MSNAIPCTLFCKYTHSDEISKTHSIRCKNESYFYYGTKGVLFNECVLRGKFIFISSLQPIVCALQIITGIVDLAKLNFCKRAKDEEFFRLIKKQPPLSLRKIELLSLGKDLLKLVARPFISLALVVACVAGIFFGFDLVLLYGRLDRLALRTLPLEATHFDNWLTVPWVPLSGLHIFVGTFYCMQPLSYNYSFCWNLDNLLYQLHEKKIIRDEISDGRLYYSIDAHVILETPKNTIQGFVDVLKNEGVESFINSLVNAEKEALEAD